MSNSLISFDELQNNLNEMEKEGKNIYKNNEFYKDLSTVMEHPEFKNFISKYFKTWDEVDNILVFIKAYENLNNIKDIKLNGYQKLCIMKRIFDKDETRKLIINKLKRNEINYIE